MTTEIQRKVIEILRILSESDEPVGARIIADGLHKRGYDIQERAVRYHLRMLDRHGFTEKHGYAGRMITEQGLNELEDALVEDRLGFVITKIEELIYMTTFDPLKKEGNVVVNVSIIDKNDFDKTIKIIGEVTEKGYTVSPLIKIIEEDERIGDLKINNGKIGIATMCSITLDGMLLKGGVPLEIEYGGTLQISEGVAANFIDLIGYRGTSIDPIEAFISRGMTSVNKALRTGTGVVLANYRSIPSVAVDKANEIIDAARRSKIDGVIGVFEDSTLGIPIEFERAGIPIFVGVNGLAAAEEMGIETETRAISSLISYKNMRDVY
ncbi:MAG: NrpR regulatory domain-containing protein [Halobacteriota archaeon]|nr:NrpR regulatory domain-containing protein [Halobacteriota archaeon]